MVSTVTIRVQLPHHLRNLARVGKEVSLDVAEPVTLHGVLNTLEKNYPMLRGTIRDHVTLKRRPYMVNKNTRATLRGFAPARRRG